MDYGNLTYGAWGSSMASTFNTFGTQQPNYSNSAGYNRSTVYRQPVNARRIPNEEEVHSRKRQNHDESFSSHRSNGRYDSDQRSTNTAQALKDEARSYAATLIEEKQLLESLPAAENLWNTCNVLRNEIDRIKNHRDPDWIDVKSDDAPIKIFKRVLLPGFGRERHDVMGRLIGIGGATKNKICETYKCKIRICGKNSSVKRSKEDEDTLLRSGNPEHSHFAFPLHVEITITAPADLAYERLTKVLSLLKKIMTVKEYFVQDGIVFDIHAPAVNRCEETHENFGNASIYYDANGWDKNQERDSGDAALQRVNSKRVTAGESMLNQKIRYPPSRQDNVHKEFGVDESNELEDRKPDKNTLMQFGLQKKDDTFGQLPSAVSSNRGNRLYRGKGVVSRGQH